MQTYTLVLGDQLFENHPCLDKNSTIVMVESKDISKRYRYHKFKLAYVFCCMREYASFLEGRGFRVLYHRIEEAETFESVFNKLQVSKLLLLKPTDKSFEKSLTDLCAKLDINMHVNHDSPMFLTPSAELELFFSSSKKPYRMSSFYIEQRRRFGIFIDENNKPLHGAWSMDKQNRKKVPRKYEFSARPTQASAIYTQVCLDIEIHFPNNPGELPELYLPTTIEGAHEYYKYFLENHLREFGDYEDAIDSRDPFLHHSLLSPLLNNGLLTPRYVLEELMKYIHLNPSLVEDHYNSLEGFVRQIIGWREWIWGLYQYVYSDNLEEYNFFGHQQDLPDYFYFKNLDSMINEPLRDALAKTKSYAYNHHIERLMILSNYMVLSEIDPCQCFRWFMEMYVDAYEWVMVGNVYGMGLFADGGIFATKPYISSSNYIKKMSHYGKGEWQDEWDTKFWAFLFKHEDFFATQPRMNMLIKNRRKKN